MHDLQECRTKSLALERQFFFSVFHGQSTCLAWHLFVAKQKWIPHLRFVGIRGRVRLLLARFSHCIAK